MHHAHGCNWRAAHAAPHHMRLLNLEVVHQRDGLAHIMRESEALDAPA